ncbi:uncharacterized protein K452DRAFT_293223 [Aplosporella prunicola CBS 121167]|uniref:Uncharacterized protein n=1 Tax=Aplosporella prunicola CBS 121167 TaxID=1176127 RepID=A0A6A6AV17_9PEZI|nr:uncharacterized protein K452DRAFT_293223 [Aplosporella prunicola CBS 121167]KAF2135436.1 hypothetical protein K452DRAFT_293223 [Aplosporella prunicola CBS 121167]
MSSAGTAARSAMATATSPVATAFRTPKAAAARSHSRAHAPLHPSLPLSPALSSSPGDEVTPGIDPAVPQQLGFLGLIRTLKEIRRGVWKHPSPSWAKYRLSVY